MAEIDELKKQVSEEVFTGEITKDSLDRFIAYADYAIFKLKEYKYGRELAKETIEKVNLTVKSLGYTDIWELEREYGKNYLLDGFYKCCLIRSFWDLESYIFFMEQDRPQEKRFYLSRINPLNKVVNDIEDLANRKIKFLGISLPSRTGKALAFDTPVLTRNGWKNHGDLTVNDEVIGLDGKFKRVLAVHNPCDMEYKVTFSDGEEVICHGNHEWVVKDRHSTKKDLVTLETKSMLGKCTDKDGHKRFAMPYCEIVEGEHKDLAVDPYTLGAWLGDGRNNDPDISNPKSDYAIVQKILDNGYAIAWQTEHKTTGVMYYAFKELRQQLQTFDMCHSRRRTPKHIPSEYLSASKEQRLQLLAGLLDTDGTLRKKEHRYCFTTTEPQLRDDFIALVHTFGWRTGVVRYEPKLSSSGIQGRLPVFSVGFNPTEYIPCQVERKQLHEYSVRKNITIDKIEICKGKKGNCITVEDGIYLVGNTLKPTHNSTTAIFGLSWLAMKRPNSHSAMGGHSGVLTKGFYKELMNLFDSAEYRFMQIYQYWHGEERVIQDKSAEDLTINLGNPDRFSTITCRSIDATWTGAVDVSWDGWLYVDDLVRDREHSLSPTRMENTWQEYLNKMVDRKSGFNPVDIDTGFDIDIQFLFPGACELMIGTLWNVYDPLYRMEQMYGDDPLYRFRKIPALDENDESNFNYPVNGFTTEYYREMRERLDDPEWMAKYQQQPYVREGILINKNELNYFNGNITESVNKIVGILDPAVGGGDYLSMVIVAEGKKKYVIDWVYSRETKGKTIPELVAKIMTHNISEVHYERNGIGRVFDDELTQALHKAGYYRCKMTSFTAPEGMSKEEKIIGYSDWVKSNLWFVDENAKNTAYVRSNAYALALSHVFTYTSIGKNKWDDAIDNLAQTGRVYEKQKNGIIDIIKNPFG